MTTLTDFIVKTAQILTDPAYGKFSTTELTQAIRQALADYDTRRPIKLTFPHEADGLLRVVLPLDFQPIAILGIEKYDDDPGTKNELEFKPERVDEQWQFETPIAITAGTSLNIKYSAPNTIANLDSGATTTVLLQDFESLCIGAAGYALLSRAIDKSESINLQQNVQAALEKSGNAYLVSFRTLTPVIKSGVTLSSSPWIMPKTGF
jgi:hypothetical protein